MSKYIVIPDSFKGTMSSVEVCGVIEEVMREQIPDCRICSIPIADGGEGTVDCFLHALDGTRKTVKVRGPFGERINSFYGRFGNTAVVEMAAAAGLSLAYGKLNPLKASTYGVGQLIRHAIDEGCRKIILGLGGSCTNDGGTGMAAALGTEFLKDDGSSFIPTGGTLTEIRGIDVSRTKELLKGISIEAMCDISNPMFGKNGAAHVFGPQKGATAEQVRLLDENLKHLSERIHQDLDVEVSHLPGSGAAGGMGAGVYAFLGGKLTSGIELLLETVKFDELLQDCNAVITGEGKLDQQSFGGKVIAGVARHARKFHIPVIAIAGCVEHGLQPELEEYGISKVFPVYTGPVELEQILPTCKEDLRQTAAQLTNCAGM